MKATAGLRILWRTTGWEIRLQTVRLKGRHRYLALDEVEVNVKRLSGHELQ